ncbi:MAG: hypothetical protein NTY38_14630 [Acidobacteria bacterium]|nr:hypothetical protein [Acidobacteriota bacterium]
MNRLLLLILLAPALWPGDTADRQSIQRLIASLNEPISQRRPHLLAPATPAAELDALVHLNQTLRSMSRQPWSEVTAPHIVTRKIRFLTPEIALVDAASVQYGSVILTRAFPMVFVLRKLGKEWKITALRTMADCLPTQSFAPEAK